MGKIKRNKNKNKQRAPPTPIVAFTSSLMELMLELELTYPGLVPISKKNDHYLMDNICEVVMERLQNIFKRIPDQLSCFEITKKYRETHPHTTDLAFIQETQMKGEREAGIQAVDITMEELMKEQKIELDANKILPTTALNVANVVSFGITPNIVNYIEALPSVEVNNDEDFARHEVRTALKSQKILICQMLRESIVRALKPHIHDEDNNCRMRVYGQPYMPGWQVYASVLKQDSTQTVARSRRMFNCLMVNTIPPRLQAVKNLEGKTLPGNVKLIVRRAKVAEYVLPISIRNAIKEIFGVPIADDDSDDNMVEEDEEGGDDN